MIGFDKELLKFIPEKSRPQLAKLLSTLSSTPAFKDISEKVREDMGSTGISILEAGVVLGFFIADEEHRKTTQ